MAERAESGLSRVVLAISSYRNDAEVLSLLDQVRAQQARFGAIIIVDSLGTGMLEPRLGSELDGCPLRYCSASTNLGSAGNLAERLRLAGETGLEWVYAINHDGDLRTTSITALLDVAREQQNRQPKLGAVYPLRRLPNRGGAYDVTGRYRVPVSAIRTRRRPAGPVLDVYWSSSNGALYSLEPVRRGLLPWGDLWMGYEDLGYGWLLHEHGYRQLLATEVVVDDGYEYQKRGGVWITQKPSWYAYYYARNFLVVAQRTHQPAYARAAIWSRLVAELAVTAALRSKKRERLGLLARGMADAVAGRVGKYRVP